MGLTGQQGHAGAYGEVIASADEIAKVPVPVEGYSNRRKNGINRESIS